MFKIVKILYMSMYYISGYKQIKQSPKNVQKEYVYNFTGVFFFFAIFGLCSIMLKKNF